MSVVGSCVQWMIWDDSTTRKRIEAAVLDPLG